MAPQDVAEWLDVSLDTAATLLELATSLPDQPVLFAALAHGDITMDRARAIARLEHPSLPSFADAAWCYRVAELDELPTDP